jgi:hypothetical protein
MYRVVGTSVNQRAWSRRPEANLAEEEARDEAGQALVWEQQPGCPVLGQPGRLRESGRPSQQLR